jgi:hypothetical protein
MAIVINGSGTVTGLAVGGLPDGTVDNDTVASGLASSKLTGALPAISAASLTNVPKDTTVGGRKNIIINGKMAVAQRGTSFTDPASGAYTLDRWRAGVHTSTGAANYTQEADAPTAAQAGTNFVNCLKIDVTTADTSTADTVRYYTRYHVEGQDIAHAGFGQAGVRYMTLSFWHKHTKTGINSFGFTPNDNGRHYVAEYTQTTSDTWEKATHTFPVDTSGNWLTDNGNGMTIYFVGHIGANYQKTANAWGAGNGYGTANQVNNFDSTSNNMRFTGVQLEMGSTATDFEQRSYGEELALCERYYQQSYLTGAVPGQSTVNGSVYIGGSVGGASTSYIAGTHNLRGQMRANPTLVVYDIAGNSGKVRRDFFGTNNSDNSNGNIETNNNHSFLVYSSGTHNASVLIFQFTASAEL